jgi:predicted dehydrogenase
LASSDHPLRFGILGAGAIAAEVAGALRASERCEAYAVAARDPARAAAFAARHRVAVSHASYDDLIADDDVDVIYVAVTHPQHAALAIRAAEAGRHVLCEKPLAISEPEARTMIDAARRHETFLLEAFAYRFHPQTALLLELVRTGAIGEVRAIDASFSWIDESPLPRALDRELAGGGILDVGCYCTSMSQLIVEAASGRRAPEPIDVVGIAALDPVERTDRYAMGILRFEKDVIAQISCGVDLQQDDHVWVHGSRGRLVVSRPCWHDRWRTADSTVEVIDNDGHRRSYPIRGGTSTFTYQVDGVAAMLAEGVASCHPSWVDSLANLRTLDRWRAAIGA